MRRRVSAAAGTSAITQAAVLDNEKIAAVQVVGAEPAMCGSRSDDGGIQTLTCKGGSAALKLSKRFLLKDSSILVIRDQSLLHIDIKAIGCGNSSTHD